VLVFRYDRIGDMIVTTPIFRLLKTLNPRLKITVLASRTNVGIIQGSRWVDQVAVLESNWWRLFTQITTLRKQRFEVLLNFIFNRTTGPAILANLITPAGSKIGQGPERYASFFNRLIRVKRFEQHMLESYVSMVEQTFGISIDRNDLKYEISVSDTARADVSGWLEQQKIRRNEDHASSRKTYLILNPSGKDEERSLSSHQVASLAQALSAHSSIVVVILDAPGNPRMSMWLREKPDFRKCLIYCTGTVEPLGELASLIEGAVLVISPDTSIIHFASAMDTPVLAVYAPANASQEWLPYRVTHDIVMAGEKDRVSDIDPVVLIDRANRFIDKVSATQVHSNRS
jgi:ADP-heptose:LPS heptosyltransferase